MKLASILPVLLLMSSATVVVDAQLGKPPNQCKEVGTECSKAQRGQCVFQCDSDIYDCDPTWCNGSPPDPAVGCACATQKICFDQNNVCKEKGGICVKNCNCAPGECTCDDTLCVPNGAADVKCYCKIPEVGQCKEVGQECSIAKSGKCVEQCDETINECDPEFCNGNPQTSDRCSCETQKVCFDKNNGCKDKGGICVEYCKPVIGGAFTCVESLCFRQDGAAGKCYCKIPAVSYEGNCCSSGCEKRGGECVTNCDCSDITTCRCEEGLCNFFPWGGPASDVKPNPCECKVEPQCFDNPNGCAKRGGQCVENCDTVGGIYLCLKNLCRYGYPDLSLEENPCSCQVLKHKWWPW